MQTLDWIVVGLLATAFPLLVTLAIFIIGGYINKNRGKKVSVEVDNLLTYLSEDSNE